ncbi:uncharacterized protein DC041_0011846 [Schistosoma bovis]|uniref:Uncharacterized protein n=1 Tax=Schistosoma bovis TaxID=6184 RepID=A0A430QBS2_SCHBO|nr:uncharacterized protein DC041_0011846 [Schistosoma bovis]
MLFFHLVIFYSRYSRYIRELRPRTMLHSSCAYSVHLETSLLFICSFLNCVFYMFQHILYNIYGGCCTRSRVSRIDLNSKVAYRHLNTEEL